MARNENTKPDLRLARVLLPVSLLREVDELVLSGRDGYETREEFFLEAVKNHVLEVKHGPTDAGQLLVDGGLRHEQGVPGPPKERFRTRDALPAPQVTALPHALTETAAMEPIVDIDQTRLRVPPRGAVVSNGIAHFRKEPLLGLHNRDFPSIWAARLLAELTNGEPIPAPLFFEEATRQAWRYAHSLLNLESRTKVKLTALFPTNTQKPQSAEEGFRAFAIGTIARKPRADGGLQTSGPLFAWQLCQLVKPNGTAHIGLTAIGYELLEALDGLTLRWPHEQKYAEQFFGHLQRHAPWDWGGFERLLDAVADAPARVELTDEFKRWQPDWSEKTASTNAAGFVARAREWGLVEPTLVDGRYALTQFGQTMRAEKSSS